MLQRLYAIQSGHRYVDQQHVRLEACHKLNCRVAVIGFPHHLNIASAFQQQADSLPDKVMVVGDYDADHASASTGTRATKRVPRAAGATISSEPFSSSSRSRKPSSPMPVPLSSESVIPCPLSSTVITIE